MHGLCPCIRLNRPVETIEPWPLRPSFSVVRALAFAAAELEAAPSALPGLMPPFHLRAAAQTELDDGGDHDVTVGDASAG
jgi:hypothetical protein